VNWETYIAGLAPADLPHAQRLLGEYGREMAEAHVLYNPVASVAELENSLKKKRNRISTVVPGLYESINIHQPPTGWSVVNSLQTEPDGTVLARTDIIGPNGARGFFERGYHAADRRLELRNAFLQQRGMTDKLPAWVAGSGVPMNPRRGTPTVQYFTLYQLKLLKVPAGRREWWRGLLHRFRVRSGPFAEPGVVASIKMSTIQNIETILHLHWLRLQHPGTDPSELIVHTASVQYAETTAVLCGYRVTGARYVVGGEWEEPIDLLMNHFEAGNLNRVAENDQSLARYSLTRATVMKQNFDVELTVEPS
jgi:hypothetical protein